MSAKLKILLVNGPNLNMLGRREPHKYGTQTLNEIVDALTEYAEAQQVSLSHIQSNSEAQLIELFTLNMNNVMRLSLIPPHLPIQALPFETLYSVWTSLFMKYTSPMCTPESHFVTNLIFLMWRKA